MKKKVVKRQVSPPKKVLTPLREEKNEGISSGKAPETVSKGEVTSTIAKRHAENTAAPPPSASQTDTVVESPSSPRSSDLKLQQLNKELSEVQGLLLTPGKTKAENRQLKIECEALNTEIDGGSPSIPILILTMFFPYILSFDYSLHVFHFFSLYASTE